MYKLFFILVCFVSSFCFSETNERPERFYLQRRALIEYDGQYFRIMNYNGSSYDVIFAKRIRANSHGIYLYPVDVSYIEMH